MRRRLKKDLLLLGKKQNGSSRKSALIAVDSFWISGSVNCSRYYMYGPSRPNEATHCFLSAAQSVPPVQWSDCLVLKSLVINIQWQWICIWRVMRTENRSGDVLNIAQSKLLSMLFWSRTSAICDIQNIHIHILGTINVVVSGMWFLTLCSYWRKTVNSAKRAQNFTCICFFVFQ